MSRNTRTPSSATVTSPATATMTITITPNLDNDQTSSNVVTLKLKGKKERRSRHITWSEDTIDNEDLDKKKSNRKTKQFRAVFFKFNLFFSVLHISSK